MVYFDYENENVQICWSHLYYLLVLLNVTQIFAALNTVIPAVRIQVEYIKSNAFFG